MRPIPLAAAAALAAGVVLFRRRVTWWIAVAAAVVVGLLAVYGSGAIELPNVEHAIRSIGPRLGGWTYPLVAGLAFLESGAFVGLVAPGEFAVVFGGFVAGQGLIDPFALAGLVAAAALAGDLASFGLGRRLGRGFLERHGGRVGLDHARLVSLEGFYDRHGGKTIVAGRFVGFARALSPFVAGASGMRFGRFVAYDTLAAALWSAAFVTLGYVFWESFDRVVRFARQGNLALTLVVVVVAGCVVAVRALRVPENRRRLVARLRLRRPSVNR